MHKEHNMPNHECHQQEIIEAIRGRLGNGDVTLATIKRDMDTHGKLLDSINHRLFVDNGAKCVQTRIDRMERVANLLTWLASVLTVSMVGVIAAMVADVIAAKLGR
jgi:hypothetical protein